VEEQIKELSAEMTEATSKLASLIASKLDVMAKTLKKYDLWKHIDFVIVENKTNSSPIITLHWSENNGWSLSSYGGKISIDQLKLSELKDLATLVPAIFANIEIAFRKELETVSDITNDLNSSMLEATEELIADAISRAVKNGEVIKFAKGDIPVPPDALIGKALISVQWNIEKACWEPQLIPIPEEQAREYRAKRYLEWGV
jgi:hypothetical protein